MALLPSPEWYIVAFVAATLVNLYEIFTVEQQLSRLKHGLLALLTAYLATMSLLKYFDVLIGVLVKTSHIRTYAIIALAAITAVVIIYDEAPYVYNYVRRKWASR